MKLTRHEKQILIKKDLKRLFAKAPGLKTLSLHYSRHSRTLNVSGINGTVLNFRDERKELFLKAVSQTCILDDVKILLVEMDMTEESLAEWTFEFVSFYRTVPFPDQDFFFACVAEMKPGSVYW